MKISGMYYSTIIFMVIISAKLTNMYLCTYGLTYKIMYMVLCTYVSYRSTVWYKILAEEKLKHIVHFKVLM